MKSYDRETCIVCSSSEYAALRQNEKMPAYLTLGLVRMIADKTGLSLDTVMSILCNELTPEVDMDTYWDKP